MGKVSRPAQRAFNQGLVSAGYTLVGVGVGAFLITQIAINLGWRNVYWIPALPAILLVFLLMRLLPNQAVGVALALRETAPRIVGAAKDLLNEPEGAIGAAP
ncbi:MAG TPA: hypothetical protein VKY19_02115 [Ktedonosporobacter sp.]|nr:hypothetical protein [Ktedonosporobacter sp.]